MKKICIASCLMLVCLLSYATLPNYDWVIDHGGHGDDIGKAIAVDAAGNVYTAGTFQDTAYFSEQYFPYTIIAEPLLGNSHGYGFFISKVNITGHVLWVKKIESSYEFDDVNSLTLDPSGNVILTGRFSGTVDFDPNPNLAYNLIASNNSFDAFILKLDNNGNLSYALKVGGNYADIGNSIASDASGSVYVSGLFHGLVDLNPNAPTFNVGSNSNTSYHSFIIKLNSVGVFQWAKVLEGGTNNDDCVINAIAIDVLGNVYTTGYFKGTVDFNPSTAASFNLISATNQNIFVSKLDASGNFVWAKQFVGATSTSEGKSITVDTLGAVYTTGSFNGTVDFNPSGVVNNLTALTNTGNGNSFVSKLNASGSYLWAKAFQSTLPSSGNAISVDPLGNVYTGGTFGFDIDMDPGAGVHQLTSNVYITGYISKLDINGNYIWANKIVGYTPASLNEYPFVTVYGLVLSKANYILFTGSVIGSGSFYDTSFVSEGIWGTHKDIFIAKLTQCVAPNVTTISSPACFGHPFTPMATGASTYLWHDEDWNTGTTFPIPVNGSSVHYTVVGTDANGCTSTDEIWSQAQADPTLTINSTINSACNGSSIILDATATSLITPPTISWSGGGVAITDSIPFIPIATSTYTVTATSWSGCFKTATKTITVLPAASVSATSTATTVCSGTAVTLTATGAAIYSWTGGVSNQIAFIPTATTTYTVTATAANGCTATATKTIIVNAKPTVTASSTLNAVCNGNPIILTGGGASFYLWSGGAQNGLPLIPSATTTYSVTGTSSNGCTNTATKLVQVLALPIVQSTTTANSICLGSPVTLNAFGALYFSWTDGVSNGVAFLPTSTNTYTVTGTDGLGCSNTSSKTITVNSNPTVSVNASSNSVCAGDNIILSGVGADYYTWTNGIQDGVPFAPIATSTYTVTGSTYAGCTATRLVFINVNPIPTINAVASNNTICLGDFISLTSGDSTSIWSNGVLEGVAFSPTVTTSYTATATSLNGCTNSSSTTVVVNPCLLHLNLKCFLQGYFIGDETMNTVLFNQGREFVETTNTDSVTVELHHTLPPYSLAYSMISILQTNGSLHCTFPYVTNGQHYYVVLKHRNSIETWSGLPLVFSDNLFYNFSSSANQVYGDNQIQVEPGVFAIYSGDINQDENIDLLDAALLENDINDFQFGYFATDINGDGNVDLLDAPVIENNINGFVFSYHP